MIRVDALDHLVLTVRSVETTAAFYARVLGMRRISFKGGRTALGFGQQKINLHEQGREFEPKSAVPTPGSGDLCFLTATPMDAIIAHLKNCEIAIEEGPVERTGAAGPILSVYLRDPDQNLIEIANRIDTSA